MAGWRVVTSPLNYETVTQLLEDLVRCGSVNSRLEKGGGERAVAELLSRWLSEREVDADVRDVGADTWNVIAHVGTNAPKGRLVLCSHLDTVCPVDNQPSTNGVNGPYMVGRGSVDAKAAVALFAAVLAQCAHRPAQWDVTLAAVGDEEVLGSGASHFLLDNLRFDAAIIGEPTGNRLVTAHRGVLRFTVEVIGKAVHSSVPHEGSNALMGAVSLIQHLSEWHSRYDWPEDPLVGSPTLTATRLNSGLGDNIVPPTATVTFDRRLVQPEDPDEVYRNIIEHASGCDLPKGVRLSWSKSMSTPWVHTPAHAAIVGDMMEALNRNGLEASPIGVSYGSDAWQFAQAGIATIIFGPGSIEAAHSADEKLLLRDLYTAIDVFQSLLWNS